MGPFPPKNGPLFPQKPISRLYHGISCTYRVAYFASYHASPYHVISLASLISLVSSPVSRSYHTFSVPLVSLARITVVSLHSLPACWAVYHADIMACIMAYRLILRARWYHALPSHGLEEKRNRANRAGARLLHLVVTDLRSCESLIRA